VNIRNRVKELRHVPASDLRPNPKNWRTHPKAQQDALRGILAEVGMADACLARELDDGSLMLIDGHLRAETIGEETVPVLILDVNEAEADKILATLDPLAGMADSDAVKLDELLRNVDTGSEALQEMIAATAKSAGLYQELEKQAESTDSEDEEEETPPSGVRMIQLFLDESSIGEFHECCQGLSEAYGTENITDTVLEAIKRERASLPGKA
jgi:ParB-like chromosome segregation protein Spo0J